MKIKSYKKDGKTYYKFRAFLGIDPYTGKPVRAYRSGFLNRIEAEKEYIRLRGEPFARNLPASPTFESVFCELIELKKISSKESYIVKLISSYTNHFKEPLGALPITDIPPELLQDILVNMSKAMKTANKVFGVVEQVFKLAYKTRLIKENPCDFLMKPRVSKEHPKENYYGKDELIDFLKKAKRDLPYMWYVFFHLLAYTGIRRGEALALKWDDLKGNVLSINKTISQTESGMIVSDTPKTVKSNREILLDKKTVELLNSLEHSSEFIFSNTKGGFITPSQPVRQLHKVKGVRYISPHGFRHTHCSLLFSSGASIPEAQQRMGHEDVKTTLQVYNHVYKEDEERALNNFMEFMN